jgi:hypothetical protein
LILSRQARHARRMTLHEAMEAILDRFCVEWSRPGEDASFDREALQLELMIPAEVFSEAIRVLVLGGFLAYASSSPARVRLDHAGVARCERRGRAN